MHHYLIIVRALSRMRLSRMLRAPSPARLIAIVPTPI